MKKSHGLRASLELSIVLARHGLSHFQESNTAPLRRGNARDGAELDGFEAIPGSTLELLEEPHGVRVVPAWTTHSAAMCVSFLSS